MLSHRGFTVAGQKIGRFARRTLTACATGIVSGSLIASTALTPFASAFAQTAPQVQAAQPQAQSPDTAKAWPGPPITAQTSAGDPPARVGRIAKMSGTVSFHTADEDQWGPATLNYPLTAGNALWTEPGARAELQIGSANRLVMDSSTELNVANLDDSKFEATLPQGTAYLSLSDVAPGDSYVIRTPRGQVQINEPGRYVIAAGDDDTPTTVSALDAGKAQLNDRGLNQTVPAGQTATLTGPLDGDNPVKAALAPQQRESAFVQSVLAEEKTPQQAAASTPMPTEATPNPNIAQNAWPARSAPAALPAAGAPAAMPATVQGMTGAQDLAAYGSWSTAPDYGSVWYPPVEAGWVPYRHGHWAYVQPWGWTWVADEPWGFAPFHYGRWVMVRDRWAWSPGHHHRPHHHHHHPRPVYAPALVAFFGSAGGASVSITAGNVGWVPLGWREPYYPPYRVSRGYIRNVNVTHVTNITRVTNVTTVNNVTVNRYVNRNSATVVNRDVMRNSQPVQRGLQTVDRRQIDSARVDRRAQIQPTAATAGMSPQSAQRMGLPSGERDAHRQTAPGPQIRQAELQRNDQPRSDARQNERRQPQSQMTSRREQQPQRMEQSRPQDNRATATAPAPRPMSREQVARPDNVRPSDASPQRQAEQQQRQRSRNDDRPQAQMQPPARQQVQSDARQQQRTDQARQQQQAAQRQQQEAQRQHMQRQQAEQLGRQRQEQRQQDSQRQQQMQQQRDTQRQQQDAQRQQRQVQQQSPRQQDVRRQQEAQAESHRQQRREQPN